MYLAEARERCIEPIEALGYKYVPEYASWIPGELFFRKGLRDRGLTMFI